MESSFSLADFIFGAVLGVILTCVFIKSIPNSPHNLIESCKKQHNVYRCEIVAQPVKGE